MLEEEPDGHISISISSSMSGGGGSHCFHCGNSSMKHSLWSKSAGNKFVYLCVAPFP